MLDLGCGDGTMSAASAHKVSHIYCLHPGYTALQVLQKRGLNNMYPVNCFGEMSPFQDNFFDGVFNIFVIEHIENPLPMLHEIRRILKPNGQLVIATDTAFYYKYLRPWSEWRAQGYRRGWRKWKPNDPTHVNLMAPSELRCLLENSGFDIIEEDIHFYTGKYWKLLDWLPLGTRETYLSKMFILVCQRAS